MASDCTVSVFNCMHSSIEQQPECKLLNASIERYWQWKVTSIEQHSQ